MTLARLFNWFLLELGSESYTILLYPLSSRLEAWPSAVDGSWGW